jgi:hypothetical protein
MFFSKLGRDYIIPFPLKMDCSAWDSAQWIRPVKRKTPAGSRCRRVFGEWDVTESDEDQAVFFFRDTIL